MAKKVLFINQETTPYVTQSQMAEMGGLMSAKMQEAGFEIRTFMPKWSTINERRGQLHEVIRLSGMNLIIETRITRSSSRWLPYRSRASRSILLIMRITTRIVRP